MTSKAVSTPISSLRPVPLAGRKTSLCCATWASSAEPQKIGAIILTRQGIENGPLRFADEFVRHKVLDLIGDLALAGKRIQGRVVAERAGHAMHTALVKKLMQDRSAWELAYGYVEPAAEKVHAAQGLVSATA